MTVLISFLGSARADVDGYREACYRLESGACVKTPYFGLALASELKPDRMVVLGTGTSMWDVFILDRTQADWTASQEALFKCREEGKEVPADLLGQAMPKLLEDAIKLEGRVIPYARSLAEQVAVVKVLADCVEQGERVVLDVTHAFRHLPMLALVAARYLQLTKGVVVEKILYGALEMTDRATGETPVINLAGLLQMLDHIEALAVGDATGDFGRLASVLAADGMRQDAVKALEEASFFLRVSNPEPAHRKIKGEVIPALKEHQGPLGALFREQLVNRLRPFERNGRWQWELAMADEALGHDDFLRCALYLQEAKVSRQLRSDDSGPDNRCVNDYSKREDMTKHCQENIESFRRLSHLRNRLAHGERGRDRAYANVLSDRRALRRELQGLRKELFPTGSGD